MGGLRQLSNMSYGRTSWNFFERNWNSVVKLESSIKTEFNIGSIMRAAISDEILSNNLVPYGLDVIDSKLHF